MENLLNRWIETLVCHTAPHRTLTSRNGTDMKDEREGGAGVENISLSHSATDGHMVIAYSSATCHLSRLEHLQAIQRYSYRDTQ